jgi:hypothetical protein
VIDPPAKYFKRSPVGVAFDGDGTPWMCSACADAEHDEALCPGQACLCGCNQHGRVIVTLDGGVRDMPEFADKFGWHTTSATVTIWHES